MRPPPNSAITPAQLVENHHRRIAELRKIPLKSVGNGTPVVTSMQQWAKTHGKILRDLETGQIQRGEDIDGELYQSGTLQPLPGKGGGKSFAKEGDRYGDYVFRNGSWQNTKAGDYGTTPFTPPSTINWPGQPPSQGTQTQGGGWPPPNGNTGVTGIPPGSPAGTQPPWVGAPAGTGGIKPTKESVAARSVPQGSATTAKILTNPQLPSQQTPLGRVRRGIMGI